MTDKEALKLALDALEGLFGTAEQFEGGGVAVWRLGGSYQPKQAIAALRLAIDVQNMASESTYKEALAQPEQEPVAFKIYKPTPPRHATPNVQNAELPWVYDQDPSSGNVASMWVTPVQALRSKT
jgi:hypothetical protein